MKITDPRTPSAPSFLAPAARLLNDPRDLQFVWLTLQCMSVVACAAALFFVEVPWWFAAPAYWLLMFVVLLDRYTLMLHCTSHRLLFKKRYALLNQVIPRLLGPFFGQTPGSYFLHHLGMHHHEENLEADLSTTMRYKRDRIDHWLRYFFRFLLIGVPELALYFYRRKKWKFFQSLLVGELGFVLAVALLYAWRPIPTLVVFIIPFLTVRAALMMGNWAQHAFVSPEAPENPYQASITCINTRHNRRCFNDGYHVLHHVKPACHWTEHPAEFERALPEYGRHDALVFDGIDFFGVWLALILRRWSHLAAHVVRLEGAPQRTPAEVIELLKHRVLAGNRLPLGAGAHAHSPVN
jgi:fatty acid desaturase